MKILIKNGQVINPANHFNAVTDLYVADGVVQKIGDIEETDADRIIDASGCWVMPGLIDLHVHLRDPGLTYKEDIETGAAAAAMGGITTIVAMPNTNPVADCAEVIRYVQEKAEKKAKVHVLQVGSVTKGMAGTELSDIEGMIDAGACALSEDGKSVMNSEIYREAMKLAAAKGVPVLAHCEDINLVNHGVMNLDEKAEALGLPGISNAVEDIIVARDILLAKETGVKLHLCHCSTADSVKMVKAAKAEGLFVTAEVCPHHFTLTSEDIKEDDGNYKMNPPLRTRGDVDALRKGLQEDVMDVISTDHAPHSPEEKNKSIKDAAFGIIGLETSVSLTISELVEPGILTPMQMAEKMSYNPAKVLGIDKGDLSEGKCADLVIIDPKRKYKIDVNTFAGKGKNTPFNQREVTGKVCMTICDGKIVYEA